MSDKLPESDTPPAPTPPLAPPVREPEPDPDPVAAKPAPPVLPPPAKPRPAADASKAKLQKAGLLAKARKWLEQNPPPAEWKGSKLDYAVTEMPTFSQAKALCGLGFIGVGVGLLINALKG